MGKNSRDRHKAKRKAAAAAQRRRAAESPAGDPLGRFDDPLGRFDGPSGLFDGPSVPPQAAERQLAEQIFAQAVHAQNDEDIDERDRCLDLLVTGPGGAAGRKVVDRAVLAVLMRAVENAWLRGWQPAELVRAGRREYAVRHGRLVADVIAGQMRSYSAATVDHRWRAQLAAVDARVWWEHDDHFVTAFGEQHGLDRAAVLGTAIDVLHLISVMPPVEHVGPLPGAAAPAPAQSDVDQRMLDRVRALLAKAESTDFPEEADAFTAKAQELMARHRIDHALLVASRGTTAETPVTRRIAIDNPYEAPKTLLLQVVAEANSCRAVWMKRFGLTTVVGFPADLESTELLFTSLLVQATRAMTQAKPSTDAYGRNTTRSFRQSFLTAYASRIGERLSETTQGVDREAAESTGAANLLPVLAARDDAVRDAFEKQFPELARTTATINNRQGWASGRAAADRASLQGRQAVAHG
ncbi:DUF2786 domain-containing protein [Solwaraspora sp. WMMD406]|uniref:DUF2786 domain-containing protein n=1 Tax=Solwaraspora sp. WMMD406 TaxID=3016095 RepID=UPI002415F813|nr:DUF2786 domain-containing protein [Solwaraspora sp. WMMD406]MDG4768341.1 DUF2786 domain-containing protein [Solwaraspora sp. WMMD406]